MKGCQNSFQLASYKIKIALLESKLQAFENVCARVGIKYSPPPPTQLERWDNFGQ